MLGETTRNRQVGKTHVVGLLDNEVFVTSFLQSAREHRVRIVDLLVCFVSGHMDVASIRYDDVVTTVHCKVS